MPDHDAIEASEHAPDTHGPQAAPPPLSATLAAAIGNSAMAGVVRRVRDDPRARAAAARPSAAGLRAALTRDEPDRTASRHAPALARMVAVARQGAPPAPPVATRRAPGSSGTHGGQRYVVYQDEVRVGGTIAWRNNNPGNIVGGAWANAHGAIATAFGRAVFPDEATGAAAIPALLQTPAYQAQTIRQAITAYAPPNENDTEAYIRSVTRGAGVPDTTRLSALTDAQLALIVAVIRRVEGWAPGTTYHRDGPPWVQALLGPAPSQPTGADAGATDAGTRDAGATDAGATDAGATDGGTPDAGATDAGIPSAGVP